MKEQAETLHRLIEYKGSLVEFLECMDCKTSKYKIDSLRIMAEIRNVDKYLKSKGIE